MNQQHCAREQEQCQKQHNVCLTNFLDLKKNVEKFKLSSKSTELRSQALLEFLTCFEIDNVKGWVEQIVWRDSDEFTYLKKNWLQVEGFVKTFKESKFDQEEPRTESLLKFLKFFIYERAALKDWLIILREKTLNLNTSMTSALLSMTSWTETWQMEN